MITMILIFLGVFIALKFIHKIYPIDPIRKGREVVIYLNGAYNRKATITMLSPNRLSIYDALYLPVNYSGRFYSIGIDDNGVRIMYIGRKRLYLLARIAELIRKIANTPEYSDNSPSEQLEESKNEPVEEVENEM